MWAMYIVRAMSARKPLRNIFIWLRIELPCVSGGTGMDEVYESFRITKLSN